MLQRHLFVSDFHFPDQNPKAIKALDHLVMSIPFDHVHIIGDYVDFTGVSSFGQDPHDKTTLNDEIDSARSYLFRFTNTLRLTNSTVKITWYEGNHENRLSRYLAQNARAIATVQVNGEDVCSIPHLFELDKLGIDYIPKYREKPIHGLCVEHGDKAQQNAGYTAHAMFRARGMSGVSGHTHRLSLVHKRMNGKVYFWIENGCLCNLEPRSAYVKSADWQNGLSIIYIDPVSHALYPQIIPLVDGKLLFEGNSY